MIERIVVFEALHNTFIDNILSVSIKVCHDVVECKFDFKEMIVFFRQNALWHFALM